MALNYNLTNQEIKDTFQQLAQVSGSIATNQGQASGSAILDGSGSRVENLHVTASHAVSSSFADLAKSATTATLANTASFFGEGMVTASAVASTITFTKDNGTTFDVTVAQSGSVESASYAAFASNAESASYATSASSAIYTVSSSYAINATSASHALISDTSLLATTASHAVSALSASHALEADHALQADDLLINVKNLSGETLAKGTAVHATGVTGENVTVIKADASIAGNMPAVALLNEALSDNATGEALIAGRLIGIDTSALVAGEPVYVNIEGALTSTKPTGSLLIQNIGTAAKINASDGEIIIQGSGRSNDLPNLTSGYAWVGNSDGVPTAVTTSSLLIDSSSTATSASHAVQADSAFTATSSSHAIQADSASFVNTLNQSVIISGSKLEIEGTNSNEGLYVEGGSVNINAKGTQQYSNMRQYYDTDKWSGNFNGYQLINNSSGSEAFTGLMAISTFTGYDGSNPVFYLQGGGNNGTYQNTILRSSYNKPWVNITKQASFDNAITASAVISASGGIEGGLTGDVTGNISSSGTSTFNNIAVTGTGSFAYIQSVTGSQKIIGESFVVLSNDTPALRYAGIKVYDSGSTNATASLEWDGLSDNWIIAEESGNTGVVLTGVTGSRGSEALPTLNSLQKGAGHHSLTNSNISDDGSKVTINSNLSGSGNVFAEGYGEFKGYLYSQGGSVTSGTGVQAGYNGSGNIIIKNANGSGNQFSSVEAYTNTTDNTQVFNSMRIRDTNPTGSITSQPISMEVSSYSGRDGVYPVAQYRFGPIEGSESDNTAFWSSENYKGLQFEKTATFNKAVAISSSLQVTGSLDVQGDLTPENISTGNIVATAVTASNGFSSTGFNQASNFNGNVQAFSFGTTGAVKLDASFSTTAGLAFGEYAGPVKTIGTTIYYTSASQASSGIRYYGQYIIDRDQSNSFVGNFVNLGSLDTADKTAFVIQGGANADADYSNTIMSANETDGFPKFQKSVHFLKKVITSGSVATEVISGSHNGSNIFIDYSQGSMFDVELLSGSNLVIEAQNIEKGMTAMIKLRQPTATGAYGSIDFADAYKFADGTKVQATQASGSVDILTVTSFDGTTLDTTSVKNLK